MAGLLAPPPLADGDDELVYPDSDGRPMADNTKQFDWIVTIKENLDAIRPDFVAGDLLWYPVKGRPDIRYAPDVLVAIGRPKGHRGSYQQWREDGVTPHVVFEIMSPRNTIGDMMEKGIAYAQFGVDEFYTYDPDSFDLRGWVRGGGTFLPIAAMNGWVSPHLDIRFEVGPEGLALYRPSGERFLTAREMDADRLAERARADAEQQRANAEAERANTETERANAAERALAELRAQLAAR